MSEQRILVIDDEPRMVDSLRTLLTMEGYQVVGENDAHKAIQRLEESDFDLVITDIKMPGFDGIEILSRAKEKDPYMGVILITGYASLDTARHAIDKGAFGYLTKPLEMDELKLLVSQSMEKRQVELERLKLLNELKVANETLELKLSSNQRFIICRESPGCDHRFKGSPNIYTLLGYRCYRRQARLGHDSRSG